MIKRIIFDIDGTLITGIDFYPVVYRALQNYGINDEKKAKIFYNNIKEYERVNDCYNKKQYLSFFSNKLNVELNETFLNYFFNELRGAIPKDTKKIHEVLSNLNNYELVLLSNYFEESQRNRLKEMGINSFFTEYYGELKIKPYKEAYLNAAGKHKLCECIIIGDDKELDIDIPKKLGFNTIYVNDNGEGDINTVKDLSIDLINKMDNSN